MSISVNKFGKDHWSVFAYLETLCVEAKDDLGRIQGNRMRCNTETHPMLSGGIKWSDNYSTRLKGFFDFEDKNDHQKAVDAGLKINGHDDWDCLDDLVDSGLMDYASLANRVVMITALGSKVAGLLRQHKSSGGSFGTFELNEEELKKMNKKPSNYLGYAMGSILQNSESETIARNIMVVLSKMGDTFKELTFEQYSEARRADGASERDMMLEKPYFEKVSPHCVSAETADAFCKGWFKE